MHHRISYTFRSSHGYDYGLEAKKLTSIEPTNTNTQFKFRACTALDG